MKLPRDLRKKGGQEKGKERNGREWKESAKDFDEIEVTERRRIYESAMTLQLVNL
jgi:hypothetical protein